MTLLKILFDSFSGFPFNKTGVKIRMKMQSGIYKIVNKINGKMYIGSSKEIPRRWKRHLRELRSGTHHSIALQRAWDKYGELNFSFEIIEITEDLLEREQIYLDAKPAYNIGKLSSGGDNVSNHPNRKNICEKHSANLKNMWANAEFRTAQLIRLNGATNPNWKGGISKSKCKNCGKVISYHCNYCSLCSNSGKRNPFFGKSHSPETKEKLKLQRIGKKPSNQKEVFADGILYPSASEAARKLGVCTATVTFRIKSKYWNYHYTATSPFIAG